MERITITLHQFVTALAVFLVLTTLILSSLAISGHIDFRDDSINVEALSIPEGNQVALVKGGTLSATGFSVVSDDVEGLAVKGEFSIPTAVTQADIEVCCAGLSVETTTASSSHAVDTKGSAYKSASGKHITIKAHSNVVTSHSLILPSAFGNVGDALKINNTDGTLEWDTATTNTVSLSHVGNSNAGAGGTTIRQLDNILDIGTGSAQLFTLTSGANIFLDAATDIKLDAGGGDIFLDVDTVRFGSLTRTTGDNLMIKSGITEAMTFNGANVTHAGDVTLSSTAADKPLLTLTTTDHAATDSSEIRLQQNGIGANGDDIGQITFFSQDAGSNAAEVFCQILGEIGTATAAAEAGKIAINVKTDGNATLVSGLTLTGSSTVNEQVEATIGSGALSTVAIPGLLTVGGASTFTGLLTASNGMTMSAGTLAVVGGLTQTGGVASSFSGALTVTGVTTLNEATTINDSLTVASGTDAINISADAAITTINIGTGGAVKTVNVATSDNAHVLTIGNATAGTAAATTIHAGTAGLSLGTTADARTTSICTGAALQTMNVATSNHAHVLTIGNAAAGTAAATTIHAGTAGLSLGTTADARTTSICTGDALQTMNVATSDNAHVLTIGNATAGTAAATTIHAGTAGLSLGTTADARTTNICTGAAVQTMNIATGAEAHVVTVGTETTTAKVTIHGQRQPVQAVTAPTTTLLASESGKLFYFNDAAATLTLPDSGDGSLVGVYYEFYINHATGTNTHKVVCSDTGGERLIGSLVNIDTDTADAVVGWPALAADNFSAISCNGTTTGLQGTLFKITNILADVWKVEGTVVGSGSVLSPFSET